MSSQSLASVAHDLIGQYAQFGKLIVGTCRRGANRLVDAANTRYAGFVSGRTLPLINEGVKARVVKVQAQVAGLVERGINGGSDQAEQAIDFVAGGANDGIRRVAATAERVEGAFESKAITSAARLALLPVAQVSLEIAKRAVEGTKRLTARVAGGEADAAEVVAKSRRVVKKAVRRGTSRAKART